MQAAWSTPPASDTRGAAGARTCGRPPSRELLRLSGHLDNSQLERADQGHDAEGGGAPTVHTDRSHLLRRSAGRTDGAGEGEAGGRLGRSARC